jgi:hypothetical protein
MSTVTKKNAKLLIRLEDARASSGGFTSEEETVEKKIHETQVKNWDTRKALALGTIHQVEAPISYVRSLLQRGNFDRARSFLEELGKTEHEPVAIAQILFERTRLAFFESHWSSVIQICGEALSHGAPPATQLALFQLRANAHFELSDFLRASEDVREVEQLGELFPHAVSLLYAKTLKMRILARDRGPEIAGQSLERLILDRISEGRMDLDLLLTCLRVEIDLKRLSRKSFAAESVACFQIADAIGDRLYSALAELDFYSGYVKSGRELDEILPNSAKQFQRVKRMADEVQGIHSPSVSAKTITTSLGLSIDNSKSLEKLKKQLQEDQFKRSILLWKRNSSAPELVINLGAGSVFNFSDSNQVFESLKAVSAEPLSKTLFFAALWGRQKFAPRLHDTLISGLLHRIKKETQIVVRVRGGEVSCEHELLVI